MLGNRPLASQALAAFEPGSAPPIGRPADRALAAILAAWQPPAPQPFEGNGQPLAPHRLAAALLVIRRDDPPFSHPGRTGVLAEIVDRWQPPDPQPFAGNGQPAAQRKLAPGIPGLSADPPPVGRAIDGASSAILAAWQPPDPPPFQGDSQPLAAPRVPAALLATKVDDPPFSHPGRSAVNAAIVTAWQPPDPQPGFGAGQALQPNNLAPSQLAVRVDDPPPSTAGRMVSIAAELAAAWQLDPWVYDYGAPPSGAQPYGPIQLNPSLLDVEVDPPSNDAWTDQWFAEIVAAWQPDPHAYDFFGGRQPFAPRTLPPSVTTTRVDNPPVGLPRRLAAAAVIRAAWEPPPPLVQPAPQLRPPVVTAPGLTLVGGFLETGPGGSGIYTIPPSHIVNIGRVAPCQVIITWLATGQSATDDWFGPTDFFAPTDFFGADSALAQFIDAFAEISISTDGVTYGPWVKYAPATYLLWAVNARMQLMSNDPGTIAVLEKFIFTVDVPDRADHYNNQAIAGGGTTITFQPDGAASPAAFNGGPNGALVPHVQVTILSATAGDQVLLTGITAAHCTVQVVNGGVGVARNCNILVIGY